VASSQPGGLAPAGIEHRLHVPGDPCVGHEDPDLAPAIEFHRAKALAADERR
jgi:hypothetical protein